MLRYHNHFVSGQAMTSSSAQLSALQIFRSVVDDPVIAALARRRCRRCGGRHHRIIGHHDRPSSPRTDSAKKKNGDVGQQPQRSPRRGFVRYQRYPQADIQIAMTAVSRLMQYFRPALSQLANSEELPWRPQKAIFQPVGQVAADPWTAPSSSMAVISQR